MSHHNYTNPAFCQQSEFYPSPSAATTLNQSMATNQRQPRYSPARVHRSVSMRSVSNHHNRQKMHQRQNSHQESPPQRQDVAQRPPRPGPKPQINLNTRYGPTDGDVSRYEHLPHRPQRSSSRNQLMEGFALVPLADIPNTDKGRYAFVPAQEAKLLRSTSVQRMAKSQDDLDRYCGSNSTNFQASTSDIRDSSFTSLPPCINTSAHNERSTSGASQLKSAFSTDFVTNKSLILLDQKNQQRYAIVPTAEDEELVDANEEIIQVHNGRTHRYAVIPAASEDDEDDGEDRDEETCLSGSDFEMSPINEKYATIKAAPPGYRQHRPSQQPQPLYTSSPLRSTTDDGPHQRITTTEQYHDQRTPSKNHLATQKLFEILSTPPRKPAAPIDHLRTPSTPIAQSFQQTPNNATRYQSPIVASTPKQSDFTPQKLQYETQRRRQPPTPSHQHQRHQRPTEREHAPSQRGQEQQRTTAIISPRLAQDHYRSQYGLDYGPDDDLDKSWKGGGSAHTAKVSRATATIGAVSLMLILAGAMNSGLCLYMISVVSAIVIEYNADGLTV